MEPLKWFYNIFISSHTFNLYTSVKEYVLVIKKKKKCKRWSNQTSKQLLWMNWSKFLVFILSPCLLACMLFSFPPCSTCCPLLNNYFWVPVTFYRLRPYGWKWEREQENRKKKRETIVWHPKSASDLLLQRLTLRSAPFERTETASDLLNIQMSETVV